MMKAINPKPTILNPFIQGFFFPSLPKKTPAPNKMLKANTTENQEATLVSKTWKATSTNGDIVTAHEKRGVKKLISAASIMMDLAALSIVVPLKSLNNALSNSEIFLSRSRLSASYTLTPVEIPRARLLVTIVTMTTPRLASAAKAAPTTIPSSIKVESNNVLMKNLRMMGPTSSLLSISLKVGTLYTFSTLNKLEHSYMGSYKSG